jgi:hypothetical protein
LSEADDEREHGGTAESGESEGGEAGSGDFAGRRGVKQNEARMTTGRMRKTRSSGSHRSIDAKRRRPPVTVAQKIVRASEDVAGLFPSEVAMRIDAQLPFIVSQMP